MTSWVSLKYVNFGTGNPSFLQNPFSSNLLIIKLLSDFKITRPFPVNLLSPVLSLINTPGWPLIR